MKLAGLINTNDHILSEDYQKATQWAYDSGYLSRDFIRQALRMLKPIYESKINLDGDYTSNGEQHILKRMIDNKKIRLFFDDFDLDWKGKKEDVIKIKSLLLSLSDMTTDMEGLSVRIALRTDVYEMIRNEEFSDKLESSVITCKWNNQEIMKALAKRICAYFKKTFDEESASDNNTLQYNIVKYLDYVFVTKFDERTKIWANAPTQRG